MMQTICYKHVPVASGGVNVKAGTYTISMVGHEFTFATFGAAMTFVMMYAESVFGG